VDASQKIIAPALHVDGKVQVAGGGHPTGWSSGSVHGPAFIKDPDSCKACHGSTLAGGSAKSCESCHPGWKTNCTFCHGGLDNKTGAPPAAVDGKTAASVPGVGRHTSHVTAGATHVAYGCALCHKVPTDALSPGHIDPSPAELAFTGAAAGTSYSYQTYTCTNIYCHGSGKKGAAGGSALWVGSLAGGCDACHPQSGLGGEHKKHVVDKKLPCSSCHSCTVNASKQISDPAKHVDGSVEICGLPTWNAATRQCTAGCHGTETW
jgi:predicted CxxxxCH...CXXCH cytochrome family protein